MKIMSVSIFLFLSLLQIVELVQSGSIANISTCDVGSLTTAERNELEICAGGLIYEGECIKAASVFGLTIPFHEAEVICGYSLAEIESKEMFERVYEYLFNTWNKGPMSVATVKYVTFWLGNTVDVNEESNPQHLVSLSNGTQVEMDEYWYTGYPAMIDGFTNLGLLVQRPEVEYGGGFINYFPQMRFGVPLCARKL
ncbi:unnamed protein product [Clavelina lepadiformis]|uniref:Uncharacterized protein n=1 Tax=Clavelina lepadiformis TaxID=159417 RepID=A0ABP0H056_CLALP